MIKDSVNLFFGEKKMNTKKLTVFVIFAIFMLSTFAMISLGGIPATADQTATNDIKHVMIVFSTGGLGDKSFNDAGFVGAQKANDTSKVKIDYVEPTTVTDINNYLSTFGAQTTPYKYDLVIAIGFSSADGVNASSIANPNTKFAIIDDNSINRSNVADITFKEQEGSFLAGAMAAMTTKSNVLGFLGGLDIPLINKFRSGYEQGARYINPNITVISQYSPDANIPWTDPTGGKQVANTEISQGADIIYAAAGGTGLGVFDAANESRSTGKLVYAIGVDSDQDYIQPGIVLTSMVKRVDTAVYNLIETTINGTISSTYMGKAVALGLKQNGVGISNMTYTSFIKNSDCTGSTTRGDVIQTLRQDIIGGSIVVDPLVKTSGFNTVAHACSVAAPTAAPSSASISLPGFEFIPLFGIFIVIPIIRKKLH